MPNNNQPPREGTSEPAEKIVQHLLRNPCDLVDTRRLMRRFRASVTDVQQAFGRLEQLRPEEENPTC
jgi:DNA-binding GntR family transcriptional regulator